MILFWPPVISRIPIVLAALLACSARLGAQGGPPMITDDPGTPGPNKWEINLGWTTERAPGSTLTALPQLDANYGIGDRIELTYFTNYFALQNSGEGARWGMGQSEAAVKWRFYDAGDNGPQISIYPQVNFLTPDSHSDRRGLADGHTSYQLPFEFERDFKLLDLDIDFGRVFSTGGEEDGWFGGVCVGREVRKGWELDAEVHVDADARAGRREVIANAATRIDLSESYTLMLLIGRDLSNSLGPLSPLMSYVGLQMRY
jgi:hypothetical protein